MTKVKARRTRLSSKNQVTIPAAVLREAQLRAGDEVVVRAEDDGRIVISREHDALDEFVGDIPGLAAATGLHELRQEWER
jgi:AbrB family looped-hinge helix DNA binding protein